MTSIQSSGDFCTLLTNVTTSWTEILRLNVSELSNLADLGDNVSVPITISNTGNNAMNVKVARCTPASTSRNAFPTNSGTPVDMKTDFSSPDLYFPLLLGFATPSTGTIAAASAASIDVNPRGFGEIVVLAQSSAGAAAVVSGSVPSRSTESSPVI